MLEDGCLLPAGIDLEEMKMPDEPWLSWLRILAPSDTVSLTGPKYWVYYNSGWANFSHRDSGAQSGSCRSFCAFILDEIDEGDIVVLNGLQDS